MSRPVGAVATHDRSKGIVRMQGFLADKNPPLLGPYSRTVPRVLGES